MAKIRRNFEYSKSPGSITISTMPLAQDSKRWVSLYIVLLKCSLDLEIQGNIENECAKHKIQDEVSSDVPRAKYSVRITSRPPRMLSARPIKLP